MIIMSGPSGVGKTSIADRLININRMKSYTTRAKRNINDDEYIFVSIDIFKNMIKENKFIEYEYIYNNYYGSIYTQDRALYVIDYKGGINIMNRYKNAISIAILPKSLDILRERIIKRGNIYDIDMRLASVQKEIEILKEKYHYNVINDNLEKAVAQVQTIINDIYHLN